jgi:hypothetical protein
MSTELSKYLSEIGAKGGRATGPSKARSSEQSRAAVARRWGLEETSVAKPAPGKLKRLVQPLLLSGELTKR